MTWSWRLERAYWATEIPVLVQRGWWLLVLIVVLTVFNAIPFIGQLINWLLVVAIGIVVVRRAIASRRFATLERDLWQSQMANWITGVWPSLAVQLGLEVRTYSGQKLVTGAGRPTWHGDTCILPVSIPAGLAREDLVAASGRIAQAFNAVRVTVTGAHLGELALRIDYVDALAEPFSFPLGGTWDGASVLMGVKDGGEEWCLPLGPHTLVAGSSGSGKASLVWGLLLGLVQPIHSGLVEVWGIDRKGGMELAMGRDALALLSRLLEGAARAGIIVANPVRLARRPRPERPESVRSRALNTAEVRVMLDFVGEGPHRDYLAALVYTGMRTGEASALRVSDVDLDHGVINVRRSFSQAGGGKVREQSPQSHKQRTVPLPAALRPILVRRLDELGRNELVFTGARGGRLNPSNVRRAVDWDGLRSRLERPDLRIHDLRHTLATLLFDAGAAANDVQAILGHSSMQVTEKYSRARSDAAVRANGALDRLLGGTRVVATEGETR
ncbi:tyrosine-type recombinase/integrase [Microbacterium lacticum]|nr:site-specific integrase [Microbacterium lacticum]